MRVNAGKGNVKMPVYRGYTGNMGQTVLPSVESGLENINRRRSIFFI